MEGTWEITGPSWFSEVTVDLSGVEHIGQELRALVPALPVTDGGVRTYRELFRSLVADSEHPIYRMRV